MNSREFLVELAKVLQGFGRKVEFMPGWESKSASKSKKVIDPAGLMIHHTASKSSGKFPSSRVLVSGRSDLSGPLCNLAVERGENPTIWIVAAGVANHAGRGVRQSGLVGSSNCLGVECENNGVGEPWESYQAIVDLAAAYRKLRPSGVIIGHKEWAPGRKIDPNFDMDQFRSQVNLRTGSRIPEIPVVIRGSEMKIGSKGPKVEMLQNLLALWLGAPTQVDGQFGPETQSLLEIAQKKLGVAADGVYGPKTRQAFLRYRQWWIDAKVP